MGVIILPAVARKRLIIGMYWGNVDSVRQFDAFRMAYYLSQTYTSLQTIRGEDVAAIYRHERKTRSFAWVMCTQALKAHSPVVLRVLREIKDLPDYTKTNMGRNMQKKTEVPNKEKEQKVFSQDYKVVKSKKLPKVDIKSVTFAALAFPMSLEHLETEFTALYLPFEPNTVIHRSKKHDGYESSKAADSES